MALLPHPKLTFEYHLTFITAGGAEEKGLWCTTFLLAFTLAKGTSEETTVWATAMIANTNSDNVLLGMDAPSMLWIY